LWWNYPFWWAAVSRSPPHFSSRFSQREALAETAVFIEPESLPLVYLRPSDLSGAG
jgi:hypothetical protein